MIPKRLGGRDFKHNLSIPDVRTDFDSFNPNILRIFISESWRISRYRGAFDEKPEPERGEVATMEIVLRLENWPDDAELDFEVENLGSADLAPQVTEHLEEYRLTAKYCAFGLEEMEDSSRPFTMMLPINPDTSRFHSLDAEVVEHPFVDSQESSPAEHCLTALPYDWELEDDIELTEDDGVKIEFVFP